MIFQDQHRRVKRYFALFQEIDGGRPHSQSDLHYEDIVYAFFQNCYHLKDWIKNDPACSVGSDVERFISNCTELKVCADICNALKHLELRKLRSGEDPQFGGRSISLSFVDSVWGGDEETSSIAIKYKVVTNSGEIDAFQLAKSCMEAWETYISELESRS